MSGALEPFEVLIDRITDFHIAPPSDNDLRDLSTVKFGVALDESLEEIAQRVEREKHLASRMGFNKHCVTSPDSEGRRYLAPFSPYVAADGAFTWVTSHTGGWGFYSIAGVLVEDLVRTKEEGFFDGDPFALLIEERRGAGGPMSSWPQLADFLIYVGAVSAGIRESVKLLRFVVETYQRQWELRGAMPMRFLGSVLQRNSWRYPELAQRLNISLAHVVDLLTALGYEQDPHDPLIYRRSVAVPKAELREALEKDFLHRSPRQELLSFWESQGTQPPRSDRA